MMNQLQMLKGVLIAYVNSLEAIWSEIAHPLSIFSKRKCSVKDYKIFGSTVYGKNLLDAKIYYPKYANDNGGITLHTGQLWDFVYYDQKTLNGVFKENTQYTFSCKYNITEAETTLSPQIWYTDGTKTYDYIGTGGTVGTGVGEGTFSLTSTVGKTVEKFNFTYGSNSKRFECELTEMQIEEGTTATEYEECNPQYTGDVVSEGENTGKYKVSIAVRGKNDTSTVNVYLDEPLKAGEVVQQSVDGLPPLPQFKGTTIYEVQTEVPPSGMEVCYYE